jgi:Ca2+-binding EF-hand superfamily protein
MNKIFSLCLSLSLCLLLAGALDARVTEAVPCMQGDADNDGSITCSEAKNFASERFEAMDTGKNNTLSMDEMETGMDAIHKVMDSNGDRLVNVQEYVTYWCGTAPKNGKTSARGNKQPQFSKMDRNRDGKISTDECVALWTVRFRDADENRDGKLSSREYVQSVIIWFADMDPNRDSVVTLSEWRNYWIGKCQAEKIKKARVQ